VCKRLQLPIRDVVLSKFEVLQHQQGAGVLNLKVASLNCTRTNYLRKVTDKGKMTKQAEQSNSACTFVSNVK